MKAVALILDPDFGQSVEQIARQMPVWVLSSPVNDPAIAATRSRFKDDVDVTAFFSQAAGDKATTSAQVLYDIDEHHGPLSSSHPYQELYVFGAKPVDLSSRAMEELGLVCTGVDGNALVLRKGSGNS